MKKILSILVAVLILVGLVGCAASENTDQSGATTSAQNKNSILTAEEAQAVALEHAGLAAEQVTLLHTRYQIDDGIAEYEVEFRYEDQEYEYDIHAETGKIREIHKDRDPVDAPAVAVPQDQPAATEPSKSKLSRDEARDIALKHAGVELSDIHGLEIEYDVDDGVPEYSVEFRVGTWELDYEIHAETGKILKSEKDRND